MYCRRNYAVQGSGLAAANYVFAQAPGNATALVVQPVLPIQPVPPEQAGPFQSIPAAVRDLTFSSSGLYDKNLGALRVCVGAGVLAGAGAVHVNDALGVEWSRVRVSPNLTNCFSLGPRNGCNDFWDCPVRGIAVY